MTLLHQLLMWITAILWTGTAALFAVHRLTRYDRYVRTTARTGRPSTPRHARDT